VVKRLIKSAVRRLGYEFTPIEVPQVQRGFNSVYLKRVCQPKTVIDVGVGYGTFPLYEAYPTAQFILVEPLREYEPAISEIAKRFNCKTYYMAVGNHEGQMTITIEPNDLQRSSLKDRTKLTASPDATAQRQIQMITLDTIYRDNLQMQPPILLKVDTEGFELEVLEGAQELLPAIDTVIAEVSVAERFHGSYHFEDLLLFMRDHGFRVCDFLNTAYAEEEVTPRYVDIAFKRLCN
jgi:FkbM family methyltransferase